MTARRAATHWGDLIKYAAMILAAGMWLGRMQSQVTDLVKYHDSEHGTYTLGDK